MVKEGIVCLKDGILVLSIVMMNKFLKLSNEFGIYL